MGLNGSRPVWLTHFLDIVVIICYYKPLMKKTYADFSSTQQRHSVLSLYSDIFPRIKTLRNELYLSSPMTSGGARRLFKSSPLSEVEVILASISHNKKLSEFFTEHS